MSAKSSKLKGYADLPQEIRVQIDSLVPAEGLDTDAQARAREDYARVWMNKYDMFCGQIHSLGMEFTDELEAEDGRGAILLTYSGSLISLGTLQAGSRWLEYASVKFRDDVPDLVKSQEARLLAAVRQDAVAEFGGSPLKHSSSIFRIAVCPPGTAERDQEQRIREATIFLTNGFIKLNRSLTMADGSAVEHFTLKSIVSYVAKKNGLTQQQTRSVIDDYLSTVESGLLLGERVNLGNLGKLSLRLQAARKARMMKNLQTGEDLLVPAKPACLVPKLAVSGSLKEKAARLDISIVGGEAEDDID